ncbi:hypothetical protein FOVG_16896 [Fusarium oxysporum f. sp. pisi HDV247]|uniref:Uncharacterized protein n=1 Tax=Fusarium oxysporum f. sp. pisi HDV247 TaxID=1080344 RepID=W9NGH8_FUSOX|nr:hypothetical protein FOVG_16896 [Fusarium oxysporum f. sp. pisi HDV247]
MVDVSQSTQRTGLNQWGKKKGRKELGKTFGSGPFSQRFCSRSGHLQGKRCLRKDPTLGCWQGRKWVRTHWARREPDKNPRHITNSENRLQGCEGLVDNVF